MSRDNDAWTLPLLNPRPMLLATAAVMSPLARPERAERPQPAQIGRAGQDQASSAALSSYGEAQRIFGGHVVARLPLEPTATIA